MNDSPFHEGEILLQKITGEDRMAQRSGRFISDHLKAGGGSFLDVARIANIALSDDKGQIWSFVVAASDQFIAGLSEKIARVDLFDLSAPDGLWDTLNVGASIGLVAMDLTSARRFRLNGTVSAIDGTGFEISIQQTCPNCPKYIQQRMPAERNDYQDIATRNGTDLPPDLQTMIETADTFFVASRHPDGSHDASHRGGQPGFTKVNGNQLIVPDYIGNSMFMTLGNLLQDPAAGLAFIDFEAGSQLNLTGQVQIKFDDPSAHDGTTGRFWIFDISHWRLSSFRPTPAWALTAYSRFNPIATN